MAGANRRRRRAHAACERVNEKPRGALSPRRLGAGAALGALFVAAHTPSAMAQATTSFTVSGSVNSRPIFTLSTLQALPPVTETVTYKSGSSSVTDTYTGPLLWNLLSNVGVVSNPNVKNDILNEVVLVGGSDNYNQVISMGEIDPAFGNKQDLVAYADTGGQFPGSGVARTVVPGDIKGGRYVSNINSLEVIHAPTKTGTFAGGLSTQVSVSGQVSAPQTLNAPTLAAMAQTSVTVSGSTYTGVSLWTLLSNVGVVTNPSIKNNIEDDYVVATGSDGYQTTIALGEIDPSFGNQPDLVATSLNGGSLGANGFARLIVPNDVKAGRWVSNLISLEVFDTNLWVANTGEITDLTGLNINALGASLNGGAFVSTLGNGVLTVPTATLNGGLIGAGVTIASPNTITQTSGTTIVQGTLQGPTIAVNGGALGLSGGQIVGNTAVALGATLGGSGQITGALNLAGGATLSQSISSPTVFDVLTVGGPASLNGALQINATMSSLYRAGMTFNILQAGGLSGAFSSWSVNGGFANWVTPTLVYTGGNVEIALAARTITSVAPAGLTGNQTNVANALNTIYLANGAPQALLNLFNQTPGSLPSAFSALSGEAETGGATMSFMMGSSFMNMLLDPGARGQSGDGGSGAPALAYAEAPTPVGNDAFKALDRSAVGSTSSAALPAWSVWGAEFAGVGSLSGGGASGASNVNSRFQSIAVGADFLAAPDMKLGFALAGGSAAYGVGNGLGSGSSDFFQFGVFASKAFGDNYLSAAGAYTYAPTNMTRVVSIGGASETLTSQPNGQTFSGRLEFGHRLTANITPYVAGQAQVYRTSATTEQSNVAPSAFGLAYGAMTATSARSELGLRLEQTFALGPSIGDLTTYGRLGWAHEFNTARTLNNIAFQAFPASTFSVSGAAAPADTALVSAGLDLKITAAVKVFARADAELGSSFSALQG